MKELTDVELRLQIDSLRAEADRRAKEKEKARQRALDAQGELVVEHVDILLLFAEHSHTDCTEEAKKYDRGCLRCTLLQTKRDGYFSDYELHLTLEPRYAL